MKGSTMEWTQWHYCYSSPAQGSDTYWVIPVGNEGNLWLAATEEEGEHIGSCPTLEQAMDLCAEYHRATAGKVEQFQARVRVATLEPMAEELNEVTQEAIATRRRGRPSNSWQLKKKGSRVWHMASTDEGTQTLCGVDLAEAVHQSVKQQPKYVTCDKCLAAQAQPQLVLVG